MFFIPFISFFALILSLCGIFLQQRLLFLLFFFEVLLLALLLLFSSLGSFSSIYLLFIIFMAAIESAFGLSLVIGLYKLGGAVSVRSCNHLWG